MTTLAFDFVNETDAIEFVRRVTSVTKAPCMRTKNLVLAMTLPDDASEVEDIARVLRGMFMGRSRPLWTK